MEAGVDTRVFKAHSDRRASVPAAKSKGLGISNTLSMADWSQHTTFMAQLYPVTTLLQCLDGK